MKALVTGAGGFIGSHLTEYLNENGFEIRAFLRYNSKGQWGWLESSHIKNNIEVILGDIRDYDSVYTAVKNVDVIFHLAALIGIPYSYVSPLAYVNTNIVGTYNILQAARELGTKQVLVTSTSETYGTAQYVPIDEKHPSVGQSPYSATKISADQLAISYFKSFGTPVKIVRPFNTYGPRQSARAIIPTIITQILAGKETIKLGSLTPTRDLTFIKDTVRGFFEIYKSDKCFGEATNIGMGKEISMEALVKLIATIMNKNIEIETETQRLRPANSEVERLMCNNQKILTQTNWRPLYTLNDGLLETIQWFEKNQLIYKEQLYNI